jgi:hypothetical protein
MENDFQETLKDKPSYYKIIEGGFEGCIENVKINKHQATLFLSDGDGNFYNNTHFNESRPGVDFTEYGDFVRVENISFVNKNELINSQKYDLESLEGSFEEKIKEYNDFEKIKITKLKEDLFLESPIIESPRFIEYDYKISSHFSTAIEYGDTSGLSEDDCESLDIFLEDLPEGSKVFEYGENDNFEKDEVTGLMSDCIDFKVYIDKESLKIKSPEILKPNSNTKSKSKRLGM